MGVIMKDVSSSAVVGLTRYRLFVLKEGLKGITMILTEAGTNSIRSFLNRKKTEE